jgi:dTDP-4-amino-4,6-dideoxygalactose transaminase
VIKLAHPIIDDDEKCAVIEALESGQLAQGPRVAAFEQAFAAYVGTKHAVAVANGTAALHLALLAHSIGARGGETRAEGPRYADGADEVIVPTFSFAATANTVLLAGARPVFVDVRDDDFNMDVTAIEAAITPRTRAIVAVHLYGQMCDIDAVAAICELHNLVPIEDAAQAVGASMRGQHAGSIGTGCFSFYATKNLTTGEGGMITTNDDVVAVRARVLRSQGEASRYVTEELGFNYRMTEVAAALGRTQLPKLDVRNDVRRANAVRLSELLASNGRIVTPRELADRRHVWHQYTVRVLAGRDARARLQTSLRDRGIESATFYPAPIHRQPLYQRLGYGELELPVAQRLADEVLSLPVHPALSAADIEVIAAAVNEASV